MIDRFGKPVLVGWPAHHILWIEAAMTLPRTQRMEAFTDIAEMTGRSYACVHWKYREILCEREAAKRQRAIANQSRAYQAAHGGTITT